MLKDLIQDTHHEIEPFVGDKARNHRYHRRASVLRESEIVLQTYLVVALALDRLLNVVVDIEILVCLGVVDIIVDAVDDAEELLAALAQKPLQMLAVVVVLNLLGVGLADGRYVVGIDDAGLHKVDRIEELKIAVVEILPVKPEHIRHDILGEDPLIFQVVNRKQRLDPCIARIIHVLQFEEHGDECGMPIVRVDDVRPEIKCRQEIEDGAAEEREALGIVRVPIESLAVEVLLIVHKVVGHAIEHIPVNADELVPPRDVQNPVIDVVHRAADLIGNRPILRQNDTAVHAILDECGGQRACHVRKTAGLYKGNCLRCYI